MKLKQKLLFLSAILIASLSFKTQSYADTLETLERYIFPEIDFKYVDFLPNGHLHKNKPRYGKYDWKVLESPHFQIYTYGNSEQLAALYLENAEATYKEFSEKMNMNHFAEKIRIVIFNSSRDFEEANIIWGLVPKGLGGETEMIKWKRVVIAFRDSPRGFQRLLRHELTHRYQGEFLRLTLMNFMFRDLPLWFIEGSAEHMAHEWDPRGELVMRDAYLNGYLARISKWSPWYTSLVYKEGEFILHFMAAHYKEKGDVISAILKASAEMKFAKAFKKATGDTLEEFDKKLWRHIEQRYSPLRIKTDIADEAISIGDGTLLAARDQFFITKKEVYGRETLFLNWTDGTAVKSKKLVEGGRLKSVDVRGFEVELSPEFGFQEHGASFASSATLAYAIDVGGQDALVIQQFSFDKDKKKFHLGKKSKHQFNGIREMRHPIILNDREAAFVGRADGVFAELFLADISSGTVKQLTSTQRTYRGLAYSKMRNALITSVENEVNNSYDLALYDLAAGTFTFLTQTPESEFYAACSSDGAHLLYISDKGLAHNIHRYNLFTRVDEVLTDAKIGIFRPQWFGDGGLAFNFISRGEMSVKTAPFPQTISISTSVTANTSSHSTDSIWDRPEVRRLREKIPDAESKTIFDVALSSDKTRALFVENRKLSMEVLKSGDTEMRFWLTDSSTGTAIQFTLDEFKKMKHYGGISLLAGTNALLQRRMISIEKNSEITDAQNPEEEVIYKESYIYDWLEGKIHDLDTEITSESSGSNRFLSKLSPDQRYFIWADKSRTKIILYDAIGKEKKKFRKEFYEIQDAAFVSETKILVLDKKWNASISELDVTTETDKTWDKIFPENVKVEKQIAWYPLLNGAKIFLIVPQKETGLDIFLFDTASSSLTPVASGIPLVKKAELKNDTLFLTVGNAYGLDRNIRVYGSGLMETNDENSPYLIVYSSYGVNSKQTAVPARQWNTKSGIPKRYRNLLKLPRIMQAQGVGGVIFGGGGINSYLALQGMALDEINDRLLAANVYLQNSNQGFADIQYYNLHTGRSYLLDYWNFDGRRHKMDVGVSQNIFLHEFLNWDVTLKEQTVRNERDSGTVQWWRSKLGTSLSLDTTIWDCQANQWYCHGPHSGAAVFTGTEIGFDHKKGFQTIEINADARYHLPLAERAGLALRAVGGRSFGPNSTIFIWGGNQTFRGIPLFSQAGNSYLMQSTELRFPILNAAGAVISGPIGEAFAPLTVYLDIRGGLYHDIGDMWFDKTSPFIEGHRGLKLEQSAGYFINIPTALGLNARFSKGLYGKQDWNFWLGYNW
ncbi:MAG: collagenase [Candidatus Harrisonbacteria bacterium]|nr:collagenase [Candidatus Harrisonbacteria bacterium]